MLVPNRQSGFTAISWVVLLFVLGFFVFTGLKLYPHYYEYFTVRNVVQHLSTNPDVRKMSKQQAWQVLTKGFRIDNVKSMKREDLYIDYNKQTGKRTIGLAYERRTHMYLNIDVVLVFKTEIEV